MDEFTVSPMMLRILLDVFTKPEVGYYGAIGGSPAANAQVGEMLEQGVLTTSNKGGCSILRLTDKGQCWVRAILSTPLPIKRTFFVVEREDFEEVVEDN